MHNYDYKRHELDIRSVASAATRLLNHAQPIIFTRLEYRPHHSVNTAGRPMLSSFTEMTQDLQFVKRPPHLSHLDTKELIACIMQESFLTAGEAEQASTGNENTDQQLNWKVYWLTSAPGTMILKFTNAKPLGCGERINFEARLRYESISFQCCFKCSSKKNDPLHEHYRFNCNPPLSRRNISIPAVEYWQDVVPTDNPEDLAHKPGCHGHHQDFFF